LTEYPKPSLTADVVALAFDGAALRVLLIRRAHDPFAGKWALPGGFVEPTETAAQGAARELQEETGISAVEVEELCSLTTPGRDPRGWVVSVAHLALLRMAEAVPRAGDDASAAEWIQLRQAKDLAFDHCVALERALQRVRARAERFPFGAELLPPRFTLLELQTLHSVVLGHAIDSRNFRKRALAWPALVPTEEKERGVRHRAARLYRFDMRRLRPFKNVDVGEPTA
jgi:ADP-ribose pyrophosphatase YjhB (NUDIX family)